MLKILVVIGSIRQNRFGDKPAHWIFNILKQHEDIDAELVDLKDLNLPMFDEPVSPSMNQGNYAHPEAAAWAKRVGEADGFIFVTPEYNHGYSSALKNAIDYVYSQWNNKPVAFVSYGGAAGGTRAVQQLRQVAVELQMVPTRNGVHFVNYWTNLNDKGDLKDEVYQAFEHAGQALVDQLLWWAKNLKSMRESAK